MINNIYLLFLKCVRKINLYHCFNVLYMSFKQNIKQHLNYINFQTMKLSFFSRIFVSKYDNINQRNMLIQINRFSKKKILYYVIKMIFRKTHLTKYMILTNSTISKDFLLDISNTIFFIKKIYFSEKSILLKTSL